MFSFSWRGRSGLTWLVAVGFLVGVDQLSKAWFAAAKRIIRGAYT